MNARAKAMVAATLCVAILAGVVVLRPWRDAPQGPPPVRPPPDSPRVTRTGGEVAVLPPRVLAAMEEEAPERPAHPTWEPEVVGVVRDLIHTCRRTHQLHRMTVVFHEEIEAGTVPSDQVRWLQPFLDMDRTMARMPLIRHCR